MLVLSRKAGECLVVGDGVTVTVLEVRGKRVRIGIDAATDMAVCRQELYRSRLEGDLSVGRPADATTA